MIRHLVVPGLLGPLPGEGEAGSIPRLPHIERLLARGERFPAPRGYAQTLFELFGLPVQAGQDVPTAAVCYQAETSAEPLAGRYLLHADPLHLRADQDRLLAYDLYHDPLSMDEAQQYAEAFNRHFAGDGLQLLVPHPARWYLAVDHVPALRTHPLEEVLARNVDLFLPQGADAARWHGWLNEVQMLFHGLPAYREREMRGRLAVNSLWFSGGGSLLQAPAKGFTRVLGECPLLAGLSAMADSRRDGTVQVERGAQRALCEGHVEAWIAVIQTLERQLADSEGEGICLMPCDGSVWHWQPRMRQRVWRRIRPLSAWLTSPADHSSDFHL